MIQTTDILAAFKLRWSEVPELAARVPGGLHGGRVPMTSQSLGGASIVAPYATLMVTELDPQFNSSTTYLKAFSLQLRVWSDTGNIAAGAIGTAIDAAFRRSTINDVMFIDGADRITDFMPKSGKLEEDTATHNATDQIVLTRQWEVMVQATETGG